MISLEIIQKTINERKGILLSPYIKSKIPIKIRCKFNHEWDVLANSIVNQHSWCPYCMQFRSEEICRIAFETIFNNKFPKYRTKKLIGVRGKQLEIDGYCGDIGIGFEHNGDQHYRNNKHFKSKYQDNLYQNDLLKIKYCHENNIKLVIIPQLFTHVKYDNLISFIIDDLVNQGHVFTALIDKNMLLNLDYIYHNDRHENCLTQAGAIAEDMGGKCLSKVFIQMLHPMEWQCKMGHEWSAPLSRVKTGSWCEQCYHSSKKRDIFYESIKEPILKLYYEQFETLDNIAKIMHISSPTISKLFKRWEVDPNLVKSRNYLLNKDKVKEIRNSSLTIKELSIKYGVNIRTIKDVIEHKTWRDI